MELYQRQEQLNLKDIPSATIVGVGGTGTWVAIYMAMSGCPELFLMDSDAFSITNFNRIPLEILANTNRPKTEAIQELVKLLRPECNVETMGRATIFTLPQTKGVIFDCTDAQAVQAEVYEFAVNNERDYIRCGYDGTHFTVSDSVPEWNTGGEPVTGYTIFPSWVVPASMAAGMAVAKAMYCPEINVSIDIKDIGGQDVHNEPTRQVMED